MVYVSKKLTEHEEIAVTLRRRGLPYRDIAFSMECSRMTAFNLVKKASAKLTDSERAVLDQVDVNRFQSRFSCGNDSYSSHARQHQKSLGLSDLGLERIEMLEAVMLRLNLTQKRLSGLISVAPSTVSSWLRGAHIIPSQIIMAVQYATRNLKPQPVSGRTGNRRPFVSSDAKKSKKDE